LPSTYARWSEYRHLTRILRERDRVFQAVPSPTRPLSSLLFFVESTGIVRKRLKTTMISMMDLRASRAVRHFTSAMARVFNVFFEEFGAGAAALHLAEHARRAELLRDPEYRARFRKDWTDKFNPKFFHRD